MSDFLNTYVADNEFFGIILSIVMFRIGMRINKKTKIAIIAMIIKILFIVLTKAYKSGKIFVCR